MKSCGDKENKVVMLHHYLKKVWIARVSPQWVYTVAIKMRPIKIIAFFCN